MKVYEETKMEELDQEWVELISKAREMGLSTEEIREFLSSKQ
ncbi:anti-repressor SinI family protein [Metabacillus litoralis]|nr:anti-repressor SinI family protein [Metabacillus litoralis]MCM3409461.1 anti-repressor SinI family protein [Metabacillus litoralis]